MPPVAPLDAARRALPPLLLALFVILAGCSGDTSPGTGETGPANGTVKEPSFAIVAENRCPALAQGPARTEAAAPLPEDTTYVVAYAFVDECTGLGGQHLIARDLDGSRRFFLGGHGCRSLPPPTLSETGFGVLRASQTAALFTAGRCVRFPGDANDVQSDSHSRVLAAFETEADARAYAAR